MFSRYLSLDAFLFDFIANKKKCFQYFDSIVVIRLRGRVFGKKGGVRFVLLEYECTRR